MQEEDDPAARARVRREPAQHRERDLRDAAEERLQLDAHACEALARVGDGRDRERDALGALALVFGGRRRHAQRRFDVRKVRRDEHLEERGLLLDGHRREPDEAAHRLKELQRVALAQPGRRRIRLEEAARGRHDALGERALAPAPSALVSRSRK